jgi:hypothetical protein
MPVGSREASLSSKSQRGSRVKGKEDKGLRTFLLKAGRGKAEEADGL